MNWLGGKIAGCISKKEKFWQVMFAKSTKIPSKTFNYSDYPSKIAAYICS